VPRIRMQYFAIARERAGADSEEIDLPASSSVPALFALLGERHPKLEDMLKHCRLAQNQHMVNDRLSLKDGDELSVIPPISGG